MGSKMRIHVFCQPYDFTNPLFLLYNNKVCVLGNGEEGWEQWCVYI